MEVAINNTCDMIGTFTHGFSAPHNYHTIEEWMGCFQKNGFSVVYQEVVRPFFPFYYTKAVFVLAPPAT